MDNIISGYVKLINHSIGKNDSHLYNFFIEDGEYNLYKLSVNYNENRSSNLVRNLHTDIVEIDQEDILLDGKFYIPKNVEDVDIDIDIVNGEPSIKGCNIGSFATFNTDFVKIFDNQMFYINLDRVPDIAALNKSSFDELVENVRKINIQDVLVDDSWFGVFEQVELPDDVFFKSEDLEHVNAKVRTNEFGNYADYVGSKEDYDDGYR